MSRAFILISLIVLGVPSAQALDCDVGVYPGFGESNGVMLHATCGNRWRAILSTPIEQDSNDWWGWTNNRYDYMVGIEYQWKWRRIRFDAGITYVNKKVKLYKKRQGPVWLRIGYEVVPKLYCGWVHSSVAFVDDAGRNQVGCDYMFVFK